MADKLKDTEQAPLLAGGEKEAALKTWLNEKQKESERTFRGVPLHRWVLGCAYMLAMGVCGIVLVALGSTLDDIAANLGTTAVNIGSVFIARGIGAVFGAVVSAKLYQWFYGNTVMVCALTMLAMLLLYLPFVRSYVVVHLAFLLLGLGTAVTDTGCQIMTRKVHGMEAGPWLGANTVLFGISGALVPVVEMMTRNMLIQYSILATVSIAVAALIFAAPHPEAQGAGKAAKRKTPARAPEHYRVEWVLSIMVFWLIGGKVTATAYLDEYVNDTGVIPYSQAAMLIMILWLAITLGRLAGLQDQRFLTTPKLYSHLTVVLSGGFLAVVLLLMFPMNTHALWIGVFFYGLFNGPCVGYCYDLNNRITIATEQGMSIVMFGLNFGASLVPWVCSLSWSAFGPLSLTVCVALSMLIPLPLLHLTKTVTYDPSVNPRNRGAYETVPKAEAQFLEAHDGQSATV